MFRQILVLVAVALCINGQYQLPGQGPQVTQIAPGRYVIKYGGSDSTSTIISPGQQYPQPQYPQPPQPQPSLPSNDECLPTHSSCSVVGALNPLAKAQCCEGLHCELSLTEGILWPRFVCTSIAHQLGFKTRK